MEGQTVVSHRCQECVGACCTASTDPYIDVLASDIDRLASHLKITRDTFLSKHVAPSPPEKRRWVGNVRLVKNAKARGGACCPFLEFSSGDAGRCSVYEARPDVCREFDPEDCTLYVPVENLLRKI